MNENIIKLQTLNEQLVYIHNQSRMSNAKNMIVIYPYAEMKNELNSFFRKRRIPVITAKQLAQGVAGIFVGETIDFETSVLCIVMASNSFSKSEIAQMKRCCKGKLEFLKTELKNEECIIDTNYKQFPSHIKDADIKKAFMMTFDVAEQEIDIVSPWMNRYVINEVLINKMKTALERGVKIRICYGIEPGHDLYDRVRSEHSDEVAKMLKERFEEAGFDFKIRRDNIHYKAVICDEKYYLEGSYNYLSFDGDYGVEKQRKEGTPFGRDIHYLRTLRQEYFR